MSLVRVAGHLQARANRAAVKVMAVAAPEKAKAYNQWYQPAGKGLGFYTGEDGYLYCDNMRVDDIRHQVGVRG